VLKRIVDYIQIPQSKKATGHDFPVRILVFHVSTFSQLDGFPIRFCWGVCLDQHIIDMHDVSLVPLHPNFFDVLSKEPFRVFRNVCHGNSQSAGSLIDRTFWPDSRIISIVSGQKFLGQRQGEKRSHNREIKAANREDQEAGSDEVGELKVNQGRP
jgi:hypothetical protein